MDVLEPLFYAAEAAGGGFVDAAHTRLVLQVANDGERGVLHEVLANAIYGDTPFALLRLFTSFPVHTRAALWMCWRL